MDFAIFESSSHLLYNCVIEALIMLPQAIMTEVWYGALRSRSNNKKQIVLQTRREFASKPSERPTLS